MQVFIQVYAKQYIHLKLKFRKNKIIMWRRTLTVTLSILCCWNHLNSASSMSLLSGFRIRFILYPLCSNAPPILVPYPVSHTTSNFPSMLNIFLFLVTVVMLALNRSVVNRRIGKAERNFRQKVSYSRGLRSYEMLRSVDWYLPTFRDNLSIPSSRGKQWQAVATLPLKIGPIGCPETSVRNYQYVLCNIPEKRRSHLQRGGNLK